jgi:tetratricopeptide (TPR) repeat protein
LACANVAAPVLAQTPAPTAKQEARDRFDRGLRLFNQGNNPGALAEFTRAYELTKHPRVLYNIGLVRAAMQDPLQAVAAFEGVLADPASAASGEQQLAAARRTEQLALIGEIVVTVNVPGARIEVDNLEVASSPRTDPIRVASGEHIVAVVATGQYPERQRVVVAAQTRVALNFELRPLEARFAHLRVKADLEGADVVVDAALLGRTPLPASLALAPGAHVIELRRLGYVAAQRSLTLGEGAVGEVEFDLALDEQALVSQGGSVALQISESNSVVFVDGKQRGAYTTPLRLPPGPHQLRVEHAGFFPFQRSLDVAVQGRLEIPVELEPTADTRAHYHDAASTRRTWSVVTLAVGGAIAIAGGTFLLLNQSAKNEAKRAYDNADLKTPGGVCYPVAGKSPVSNPECEDDLKLRLQKLTDVRDRDLYGFLGLGVGVAAAGVGLVLLLTGDDPGRYDRRPAGDALAMHRMRPMAWFDAHGGGISLYGAL